MVQRDRRRIVGEHPCRESLVQVGAMDQVVAFTIFLEQRAAAIDPAERPRVLPVAHALVFGLVGLGLEHRLQAEPVEAMRGRGAQRQPRAHLAELRRLLMDRDAKAQLLQCERRAEPADAGADDGDV